MPLPADLTPDHVAAPVELRRLGTIGYGLFLIEPVPAGETVLVFGGSAVHASDFRDLSRRRQQHALQVDDDVYLVGGETPTLGEYVNHSCDPTTLIVGQLTLIARRDLRVGDQLTYDYATTDSTPYDEFECECGAAICRGKVTGEDWLDPELRERYDGHFSTYLQRRIDRLVAG